MQQNSQQPSPPDPPELDLDKIAELEAKCPEIVRFLRSATEAGTDQNKIVSGIVDKQINIAKAAIGAVHGRVPAGLGAKIVDLLQNTRFCDGIAMNATSPDKIRAFIKLWLADNAGIYFEYGEIE